MLGGFGEKLGLGGLFGKKKKEPSYSPMFGGSFGGMNAPDMSMIFMSGFPQGGAGGMQRGFGGGPGMGMGGAGLGMGGAGLGGMDMGFGGGFGTAGFGQQSRGQGLSGFGRRRRRRSIRYGCNTVSYRSEMIPNRIVGRGSHHNVILFLT
jgi:hypothetical protein